MSFISLFYHYITPGETLTKGTRVKRGPCWNYGDGKVGPTVEGTILEDAAWGTKGVKVKWDNAIEMKGEWGEKLRWGAEEHGVENCDIWDSASGQITKTLTGHKREVTSVTFSPDGSQLASASRDRTVKVIWNHLSSFLACLEFSRSNLAHFYRSGISLPAKSRKL